MARIKKQSLKKQTDGVWVEWEDGIELKIARLGCPRSAEVVEKSNADQAALKAAGKPLPSLVEINATLVAYGLLMDWRNVEDDDGKPLKYTPELGERYLRDPAYSDLSDFVQTQSQRRANYLNDGDALIEKNSQPLSSLTSPSAETSGAPLKSGATATTQSGEPELNAG